MKKICVVTGTRAEYGQLRLLIQGIEQSKHLKLCLIATGAHLSNKFGLTYKDIEADGLNINHKIKILSDSDTSESIAKSMGRLMIKLADVFKEEKPNLVLILGDRYEIFVAASSAMIARIPIAHIHGGEKTEGAIDDAIRHSITKMSHFHFVAHNEYRKRVIQLGEDPKKILTVGGLGVDCIKKIQFLDIQELQKSLSFTFGEKNLLVTFHPVTLEKGSTRIQMKELLSALSELKKTHIIFTMPNADPENEVIISMLKEFVNQYKNSKLFSSLGQLRYLSTILHVDCVIGNSSSGLCEVPSFKKPTINIGNRQKGRIKAGSVIDCDPNRVEILKAIKKSYSDNFMKKLKYTKNPYGDGDASKKILKYLEMQEFIGSLNKSFIDI